MKTVPFTMLLRELLGKQEPVEEPVLSQEFVDKVNAEDYVPGEDTPVGPPEAFDIDATLAVADDGEKTSYGETDT